MFVQTDNLRAFNFDDHKGQLVHGFCRRYGGVSTGACTTLNFGRDLNDADGKDRSTNFRLLSQRLVAAPEQLRFITLRQVSGTTVVEYDSDNQASSAELVIDGFADGDALICRQTNTLLTVRTADCLPILLADPYSGYFAAVHVGWPGALAGIIHTTIEMLVRKGVEPKNCQASLGPALCSQCLELRGEAASKARQLVKQQGLVVSSKGAAIRLDLQASARCQLETGGLRTASIQVVDECTSCSAAYFSHRRLGATTGRQLSFIGRLA